MEICAGSGGLASGAATLPDFETLALLDTWPVAGFILRHGKPWDPGVVHVGDVRGFPFRRLRNRVGLLSGGPPCQPWSRGGRRRGHEDPRDLLGQIDRVLAEVRPEAFVFENVPGLASERFGEYFADLLVRLRHPSRGLRYGVHAAIFDAANFGVAQTRRRIFFVGIREATTRDVAAVFDRIHALAGRGPGDWLTVGEALADTLEEGRWMRWPYGPTAIGPE